ncbi:MAG: response regulator [Methanoregula sp.]|nr:response regulator [Methanoregula sp.]
MQSVLVIDDEEFLRDATRSFLERFGNMNVQTASSSKEALEILMTSTFDALVLDYYLPEINGIQLLKILRAKGDTTPVIMFTGVGRENAAIEALNNGADFFLKKGEDPSSEFRELVHMINRAVERRFVGKSLGVSEKILSDTIDFFRDAAFAIDREGKVLAWNPAMAEFTGVDPTEIIGKGEGAYSVPILGYRAPVLGDLIFEKDEAIAQNKFMVIARNQETLTAWIKVTGSEGIQKVLWMKAMPLHDAKGTFIASITMVRDITGDLGDELLRQADRVPEDGSSMEHVVPAQGSMLNKLFGKAKSLHKDGLSLSFRQGKYREAIPYFTQAIEMDPTFAFAWHDRGVCLREIGSDDEALKDFDKAAELLPDDEEVLFSRADHLKKIGILKGERKTIDSAIRALNRTLEINPNHANAWNSLAVCMKELGKEETAKQYFERSNELIKMGKARYKKRNLEARV